MYFILSKVLLILILPFMWVFGLLIYAIFTKNDKRRRGLVMAAVILLTFFGSQFIFNRYAALWDVPPQNPGKTKYSCVILLGGFTSQDANGKGFFNDSKDRYVQATRLLAIGTASHLLMTGGNGNLISDGFTEGEYVRGVLKEEHYADSAILIENRSRNTFENAAFSKAILKKANLKPPYLLVTSAFHMKRAMLIFKKEGMEVVPFPCDYKSTAGVFSIFDVLPAPNVYDNWNKYIKELVGYIMALIK